MKYRAGFLVMVALLFALCIVPDISRMGAGESIAAAYAAEGEAVTPSLLYYVFLPACNSCGSVHAVISRLPAALTITKDGASFQTTLTVKAIDLSKEPGLAEWLFKLYQVPQDQQYAPIVFLGNTYYAGAEAIEANLENAVAQGLALNTPALLENAGQADTSALTFLGTAAAGLIGGLNPCALSMLLMFFMVLANAGRNSGGYAAAFLGAKFLTYLLLGTALLGTFQLWNPTWLPLAIRWLMTMIGGAVILMNLWDARAAHKEQYGSIRNQLPGKMRKFLHGKIQSLGSAKHLMPAAFLLGIVVAAGEFLCAGQLYLATLLAALHTGTDTLRLALMLALYCLCFLAPSTALAVALVRGKAAFSLSEAIRAKMPLIKVLTAAVMLLILIFIWL